MKFDVGSEEGSDYTYIYPPKHNLMSISDIWVFDKRGESEVNMLVLEYTFSSFSRDTDRLWIEFPAPWPDTIVSGDLECATDSPNKISYCIAVDGDAANFIPAKIYIGGFKNVANGKILIRGITNPAEGSLMSINV